MKFYLAPMEGITGYVYRNAYDKYFNNIDKYFTPFIVPNKTRKLKTKELRDILPENNNGLNVAVQILSNNSEQFIDISKKIIDFGYDEINLNLGCPSSTVVSKGKGAGFLSKLDDLDRFLDQIYKIQDIDISIKTRIGMEKSDEFYDILNIYNKYPVHELIIHPRTRSDFYNGTPNMKIFKEALSISKCPVCYNGDIFTSKDFNDFSNNLSSVDRVMIGRGIIGNPWLVSSIKDGTCINKKKLLEFHNEILNGYIEMMHDDKSVLFKMKELWLYMIYLFSNNKRYLKSIKKSQKLSDLQDAVNLMFANEDIEDNPEIIWRN